MYEPLPSRDPLDSEDPSTYPLHSSPSGTSITIDGRGRTKRRGQHSSSSSSRSPSPSILIPAFSTAITTTPSTSLFHLPFRSSVGTKIFLVMVTMVLSMQLVMNLNSRLPRFVSTYSPTAMSTMSSKFGSSPPFRDFRLRSELGLSSEETASGQDASSTDAGSTHLVKSMARGYLSHVSDYETEGFGTNSSQPLPECPPVPPKLVGPVKVLIDPPALEDLRLPGVEPGGRHRPPECRAKHRVAIIIPYRDREIHLRTFLYNIHPILMRQQIDYGIFVVEQIPDVKFNRAKLMNIGFVEALKLYDYQCFIFHDVDLLPEDDRNLYTCPQQPRHMSVAIDVMHYRLPYKDIFGGVSALTKEHMLTVNGFSNEFWGWGGEDDDMSNRIRYHKLKITRYKADVARYRMLKHRKETPNPERYNKLYKGRKRFKTDGINSLNYKVVTIEFRPMFTWILVDPLKN